MLDGRVRQEVADARCLCCDQPRCLVLAVEHPHRVRGHPVTILGIEVSDVGLKMRHQGVGVDATCPGIAHRVHQQQDVAQADAAEHIPCERHDLDVDVRVGRTDRLHAKLMVLAHAASLGPFVAEMGRRVKDLPRHRWPVLNKCPHDRCSALWPQSELAIALVGELVHLFGDDIGAFTDASEHTEVLKHRTDDQAVPVQPSLRRKDGEQRLPPIGLWRHHVVSADRRLKRLASRHRVCSLMPLGLLAAAGKHSLRVVHGRDGAHAA